MANKPVSKLNSVTNVNDADLFLLSKMGSNSVDGKNTSDNITWGNLKQRIWNYISPLIEQKIPEWFQRNFPNWVDQMYPVGSIYITTSNLCPLEKLISGSKWQRVPSKYFIQQAPYSNATLPSTDLGKVINQGLPDISGSIENNYFQDNEALTNADCITSKGALWMGNVGQNHHYVKADGGGGGYDGIYFRASKSNSIYGNSSDVQPNAYLVNMFRRIK